MAASLCYGPQYVVIFCSLSSLHVEISSMVQAYFENVCYFCACFIKQQYDEWMTCGIVLKHGQAFCTNVLILTTGRVLALVLLCHALMMMAQTQHRHTSHLRCLIIIPSFGQSKKRAPTVFFLLTLMSSDSAKVAGLPLRTNISGSLEMNHCVLLALAVGYPNVKENWT